MNKTLLCFFAMIVPILGFAQKPSLVEIFQNGGSSNVDTRSTSDDVIVVDLSEYENVYYETLNIATGKTYRFINGDLNWKGGDTPLISISKGSTVEIGDGATFWNNNDGLNYRCIIEMNGGNLIVNGGRIIAEQFGNKIGYAVYMKSGQNVFLSINGDIYGNVNNNNEDGNLIRLQGGHFHNEIITFDDVIIENNPVDSYFGNIFLYSNNKIKLGCELTNKLSVGAKLLGDGFVFAEGYHDYVITNSDVEKMEFSTSSLKDRYYFSLENNQVVVRKNQISPNTNINIPDPGTLSARLTEAAIDIVTSLTVTGNLNGDDIVFIERMGKSKLEKLNMSGANIVTGGTKKVGTKQEDFGSIAAYHPTPGVAPQPPAIIGGGTVENIIPSFAFAECNALKEVLLPNSVTIIKEGVFANCQQLQKVVIGTNTSTIEYGLCRNCPQLESVINNSTYFNIKNGIGYNQDQSKILFTIGKFLSSEIAIPASVKEIHDAAFNSEKNLKLVYFEKTPDFISIGANAFAGSGVQYVTLNRPSEIGNGAFYNCSELREVTLTGETLLRSSCLENCPNLKKLAIPEGVQRIERYACYNSGIEELTLPSTLTYLGAYSFSLNKNIKHIYTKAKTPPTFASAEGGVVTSSSNSVFYRDITETCIVHVPSGCVHAYKLDLVPKSDESIFWGNGWSDFKHIVCDKGNLKDLFGDEDPNASEENPTNVTEGTDEVDITEPDEGKPNLHVLFGDDDDNIPEGTQPKKNLHFLFDGEYGFTIEKTSSYEFKNINIDLGNHNINRVIYVDGTLIININVYFINVTEHVKHIIYVRKGGRVIWRGGKHYHPGIIIVNEGGTIIYENGDSHGGTHGISNTNGTIDVKGGHVGGNIHGIHNQDGGIVNIHGGHIYGGGGTSGGNSSSDGGHAIWNGPNGWVNIYGGEYDEGSSIWSDGNLLLDGKVNIRNYYIRRNITIKIISRIVIDWYFYFIDKADFDLSKPLFVGEDYTFTEEDLKHIHIVLPDGYKLVLDGNRIVIQKESTSLETEADLQALINASVGKGSISDPVLIEIPTTGITLTHFLRVPESAHVKLIGGQITLAPDFVTGDGVVYLYGNASLSLENMTWDMNGLYLKSSAYINPESSQLVFGKDMVFKNTWNSQEVAYYPFVQNRGTFIMESGYFSYNGLCVSDRDGGNFGEVHLYGGSLFGVENGSVILHNGSMGGEIITQTFTQEGGTLETGQMLYTRDLVVRDGTLHLANGFKASGHVELTGGTIMCWKENSAKTVNFGNISVPDFCGDFKVTIPINDGRIRIGSPLNFNVLISSEWEQYDFAKSPVVVEGYTVNYNISQEDFDHITFVNLPSGVKAKLITDNSPYIALVKSKKNLHELFEDLEEDGTETNPVIITPDGVDDVDITEPDNGKKDLHVLFGDNEDNVPEGTQPKKNLHFLFDGEFGLIIDKTSSYEFKNINIDLGSHTINNVIFVDGTLIININVYFINVTEYVKHIIYVRKGGRVIWRGGTHYHPGIIIVNEGGTVIYENGDSNGGTHGISNSGGTVDVKGGNVGGNVHGIHNQDGGIVNIYGGFIYGGGDTSGGNSSSDGGHTIWNGPNSWLNIFGGEYNEGSSVWSEGNLLLDGRVTIRDFYIRRNITIKIISRIIINWYFYFIDATEFDLSKPLFVGENYTLTEDDLNHIHITLPNGYYLVLNVSLNAIYITQDDPSAIDDVIASKNQNSDTYLLNGIGQNNPVQGFNIIDGKKVFVK